MIPQQTKIQRDLKTLYPIAEIGSVRGTIREGNVARNVAAQWTGEKRPPRKGEWYLSGSYVEAWRAPNDLSEVFHIARLVRVTPHTTYSIEVLK